MLRTNPGRRRRLNESTETPRDRTGSRANGILGHQRSARLFVGATAKTWGGGGRDRRRRVICPGNIGSFSVRQSRTDYRRALALQSATIDLPSSASMSPSMPAPGTWAAIVHGFGNINSRRDTGPGFATCRGYNARLEGRVRDPRDQLLLVHGPVRVVPRESAFALGPRQKLDVPGDRRLNPVVATGATVVDRVARRACLLCRVGITGSSPEDFETCRYGKFVKIWCELLRHHRKPSGARAYLPGIGEKPVRRRCRPPRLPQPDQHRPPSYINYDAKFAPRCQSTQGTVGGRAEVELD